MCPWSSLSPPGELAVLELRRQLVKSGWATVRARRECNEGDERGSDFGQSEPVVCTRVVPAPPPVIEQSHPFQISRQRLRLKLVLAHRESGVANTYPALNTTC